jgi:hypothetical protein
MKWSQRAQAIAPPNADITLSLALRLDYRQTGTFEARNGLDLAEPPNVRIADCRSATLV